MHVLSGKVVEGGRSITVPILPGEVPVFWACGVTPQSVLENSKPDFCITHSPGKMLITDKLNNDLAAL